MLSTRILAKPGDYEATKTQMRQQTDFPCKYFSPLMVHTGFNAYVVVGSDTSQAEVDAYVASIVAGGWTVYQGTGSNWLLWVGGGLAVLGLVMLGKDKKRKR